MTLSCFTGVLEEAEFFNVAELVTVSRILVTFAQEF